MRGLRYLCVVLAAGLLLASLSQVLAGGGERRSTLIVRVTGLRSDAGVVRFALHNNRADYMRRKNAFRTADLPIQNRTCVWEVTDLPYVEYAVMVHHDENDNHEMDNGFLNVPNESYGFSNNPKIFLGPPAFAKTKFRLANPRQTIEIDMR